MIKLLFTILAALMSSLTTAQGRIPGNIEWLGGDLPPFIWKETDNPRGYGVELIAEMSTRLQRPVDINFLPWARAVATARDGSHYGVLPLARTPDREDHYRWLIKLAHVRYTFFYLRKGEGASFANDLDALRSKKVGVLRGSPIINNLQNERFSQIVTATTYNDLLRLLDIGAIDAAYAGYPMMTSAIRQSSFAENTFGAGTSLSSADLYIGTSLRVDADEADRWLKAYKTLQSDGTVARLRRKYDLPPL